MSVHSERGCAPARQRSPLETGYNGEPKENDGSKQEDVKGNSTASLMLHNPCPFLLEVGATIAHLHINLLEYPACLELFEEDEGNEGESNAGDGPCELECGGCLRIA